MAYLILGWLFGLLSPRIVDAIRNKYVRRDLAKAIRSEAGDLQYRVAISSFLLAQEYGEVSKEYLAWLKPKVAQYKGNEPIQSIQKFVQALLDASNDQLLAVAEHVRAPEGKGLSLKRFSASFVEASIGQLQRFPANYQVLVHEFRNQLSVLNQEIDCATEYLRMTFDSSLSGDNHARLTSDLSYKYTVIQGMCMRVADRLQAVIDYRLSKI